MITFQAITVADTKRKLVLPALLSS